jgi:hypothetical protein
MDTYTLTLLLMVVVGTGAFGYFLLRPEKK